MTDDWRWVIVRWALALVVLGLVVVYAFDGARRSLTSGVQYRGDVEEEPVTLPTTSPTEAPPTVAPVNTALIPTGPVQGGTATPLVDLTAGSGGIDPPDSNDLLLGPDPGETVLLSFPLIPGSPDCVETARLQLFVRPETVGEGELRAFPSALFDLGVLAAGTPLPADPVLDAEVSVPAFTDGSSGGLQWDVTSLYKDWSGAVALSNGQVVPPGTPFTVAIRPSVEEQANRRIVFAASEAGAQAPTLTWNGLAGCGG